MHKGALIKTSPLIFVVYNVSETKYCILVLLSKNREIGRKYNDCHIQGNQLPNLTNVNIEIFVYKKMYVDNYYLFHCQMPVVYVLPFKKYHTWIGKGTNWLGLSNRDIMLTLVSYCPLSG